MGVRPVPGPARTGRPERPHAERWRTADADHRTGVDAGAAPADAGRTHAGAGAAGAGRHLGRTGPTAARERADRPAGRAEPDLLAETLGPHLSARDRVPALERSGGALCG